MNEMLKCEDVILKFIKSHPDVTVVVEYDVANDCYVIGINTTRDGRFKKHKFVVSSKYGDSVSAEVFERLLFGYSDIMENKSQILQPLV